MDSFTFGEVEFTPRLLATYEMSVDGADTFITPEWDYEFIDIPGRNGSLTLDNKRMKNITLVFHCFIRNNFVQHFRDVMNTLAQVRGYAKLKYSDDPGFFRMAVLKLNTTAKTGSFNKSGHFDIEFTCKPERFYDAGDQFTEFNVTSGVDGSDDPIYATTFPSNPVFRIYGSGTVTYAHSGSEYYSSITVRQHPYEYVDIDSESMTASYDGINLSQYVSLPYGYPKIEGWRNNLIAWNITNYGKGARLLLKTRTFLV